MAKQHPAGMLDVMEPEPRVRGTSVLAAEPSRDPLSEASSITPTYEHGVHHVRDHMAASYLGRIPSGLDRLGQNSYLAARSQRKLPSEMPGKSGYGRHTPAASVRICPPAAISEDGLCTS